MKKIKLILFWLASSVIVLLSSIVAAVVLGFVTAAVSLIAMPFILLPYIEKAKENFYATLRV